MNEYWNNLRPLEKRLVVAVGSALFVVLNFWFVVPHFGDWSATEARVAKARKTLALYQGEIAQAPKYNEAIKRLEGDALDVAQEEQMGHFSSAILSEAARSGFVPSSTGRMQTETNQFFLELSQTITVACKEQELVNFLYNLGSGNSLIRVRDLGLHPDPPRQQLMASIKLVASYQRKVGPKPAPAAAAPAAKTAAPATPKSAATPAKMTPPAAGPAGSPTPPTLSPRQKPSLSDKKKL